MRIRKVSQSPIPATSEAQIIDGYSTSTTDGYSANYINELLSGKIDKNIPTYFGDLNNVKELIVYAGTEALNRPDEKNGFCITMIFNDNYKKQLYFIQNISNLSYERTCNSGTWTDWKSMPLTVFSKQLSSSSNTSFIFSDGGLYVLIAHTNGNDSCIVDVIYGNAQFTTRIKEDSKGYLTVTYSSTNKEVTINSRYSANVRIIKF